MPTCRICLHTFKSVKFKTEHINICTRCVNTLNGSPEPAKNAEARFYEKLERGMLRNAERNMKSDEEWKRQQAQQTLANPYTAVTAKLHNWITQLLSDSNNSTRDFKIMRAHRRGLLRMEGFSDYREDWKEVAQRIRRRDGFKCTACGATNTTLDVHHIIYLSHYGTNQQSNLITLCRKCHEDEHDRVFDFAESQDPEPLSPIQPKNSNQARSSERPSSTLASEPSPVSVPITQSDNSESSERTERTVSTLNDDFPLHAYAYMQKYGVTEKQLDDAIRKGQIKSYSADGTFRLQDINILKLYQNNILNKTSWLPPRQKSRQIGNPTQSTAKTKKSTPLDGYSINLNTLARVWRGEASLAKTYWYYGVLTPVSIEVIFISAMLFIAPNPKMIAPNTIAVAGLFHVFYSILFCVPAVWRSSKCSTTFWKHAARAVTLWVPLFFFIAGSILSVALTSTNKEQALNHDYATDVWNEGAVNKEDIFDNLALEPKNNAVDEASVQHYSEHRDNNSNPQELHEATILAIHPDAWEIVGNNYFNDWVSKSHYFQYVVKDGTTQEVIDMLTTYKRHLNEVWTVKNPSQQTVQPQPQPQPQPQKNYMSGSPLPSNCEFKPIMTNADYEACGISAP